MLCGLIPEPPSELDLLPSFRLPLGRLKLQILQVEGVHGSDRPYVVLHHEGKVETTEVGWSKSQSFCVCCCCSLVCPPQREPEAPHPPPHNSHTTPTRCLFTVPGLRSNI